MAKKTKRLWIGLWQRIAGNSDMQRIRGVNIYDNSLVLRYREPHRHYHTLCHIENCLREFRKARPLAQNPDAIEFAIWYHDAIYDTKDKDNEEKSALLATDVLKSIWVRSSFVESVTELIMATKHTALPAPFDDIQLIVDIDLSILGYPEEKFDEYEKQIRKEYEWVPE